MPGGRGRLLALVVLGLLLGLPGGAQAVVLHSPDDLAPDEAPAHWLPPEPWVYNHWVPYDERRLYRLLRITREDLWRQLRDDRRTLAGLAARHGWRSPRRLAAALVAPRRARVGRATAAELERRALRTITQGHLAQHLFFHSLHQFAIPSAAPDIFGVTDAAFRRLRRQELSPLAIGRLHGRSPGRVQAGAIAVLRERVRAGVTGGDIPPAQAALLLRRQLTQLPRWLDQARYNGPPLTHRGALVARPKDYASNPAISLDGRFVAYEAYRQKLPLAVRLGEIAVLRTDLDGGATTLASPVLRAGPTGANPASAYNPSISADGAVVTYESSAGNQNFAKRYGRIRTLLCDLSAHATREVDEGEARRSESRSSYNPRVSADGRRLVFQAVRGGRTVVRARAVAGGATRTVVAGARADGARYADPYEPALSADGSRLAYTMVRGTVADARSARSSVLVRDLRTGTTFVASRTDGGAIAGGFSSSPAISPDGRFVAFTSTARNLGGRGLSLYLRDLAAGRTLRIPTGGALPLDPAVSAGGAVVTFTAARGSRSRIVAWRAATGRTEVVSRASGAGGAIGDGWAEGSSVSGDGTRVVFASSATNLDPPRRDGARAIYLRDLTTQTTRAVSDVAAAYRTAPRATAAAARGPRGATVDIIDNAFVRLRHRPVVRVRRGAVVTWRWRSQQSHSVLVRSGPERFASPMRNRGAWAHRFRRAGTYRIVCSLHAPGMRMTVVVRR